MTYTQAVQRAHDDPAAFWLDAAKGLEWDRAPQTAYDPETDIWFPDGMLNTCHNAVDRHVAAGHGEQVALIYESPVTGVAQTYTYSELLDHVSRTAGMLAGLGVTKGDRVVIYMPMVPEAVFAMLACARIGAVHSVVFGGFAAPELAKRIDDCEPVVVLSASCGFEPGRTIAYKPLLDKALDLATHKVPCAVILQREQLRADLRPNRDIDWGEACRAASPAPCVPVASSDPLYILYTSGTTGTPKGVVRDNGGHATALNWSMGAVLGMKRGDVFWAASDIGWVVGHSYIVYGSLLAGCPTILFEGKPVGTPDAGIFWRLVEKHQVRTLFTAPTALRAIRRADPDGKLFGTPASLQSLRVLFLGGERTDPDTLEWISGKLDNLVIDHWWQTELGWPALAICIGLGERDTCAGSAGRPVPGYRFVVKDDEGRDLGRGTIGNLSIEQPLPPGVFRSLWNNPERYAAGFTRFPGYYQTGDAGKIDEDGFVHIMGRTDDIINVAGHRLSTGQMEEVVAAHRDVIECAVIGAADELKGEMAVIFATVRDGAGDPAATAADISRSIREAIGPIATPRDVHFVDGLPKTRSGKILRNLLRAIVNGGEIVIPQTVDDASVVDRIVDRVRAGTPG